MDVAAHTDSVSTAEPAGAPPPEARRRNAVLIAALVLLANSVLRGIRMPGYWAATHLLFNYQFGFSKRGLIGSLIAYLNSPFFYSYRFCLVESAVFLAANLVLLALLIKRLIGAGAHSAVLVYASSAAIVFLAHTIGYFEQITLLVTLLALRIQGFYARAMFVAVFFSLTLLIHETGFLLFFPVLCFSFLIDLLERPERLKTLTLAGLVLAMMAETLLLGQAHLSHPAVAAMQQSLQAHADFPLRDDAFVLLERSLKDNLRLMVNYWTNPLWLVIQVISSVTVLPTTVYLVIRTWRLLEGKRLAQWAAVIASLAPLSLHVLGMDLHRWNTLATTTSFLVFAMMTLRSPTPSNTAEPVPISLLSWTGILIMLNLTSAVLLFDDYVVQDFPFHDHLKDVLEVLRGHASTFAPHK
jgi:hypothetical protein